VAAAEYFAAARQRLAVADVDGDGRVTMGEPRSPRDAL